MPRRSRGITRVQEQRSAENAVLGLRPGALLCLCMAGLLSRSTMPVATRPMRPAGRCELWPVLPARRVPLSLSLFVHLSWNGVVLVDSHKLSGFVRFSWYGRSARTGTDSLAVVIKRAVCHWRPALKTEELTKTTHLSGHQLTLYVTWKCELQNSKT